MNCTCYGVLKLLVHAMMIVEMFLRSLSRIVYERNAIFLYAFDRNNPYCVHLEAARTALC